MQMFSRLKMSACRKKVCCTYQQRCSQGEMVNTDQQAAILITFLPEHFQPLAEARRSCIDRQRCGLAEISDIKECVKAMAEHLRGNVEYRLEELRLDIQEWS